jgi:hypothetical protein
MIQLLYPLLYAHGPEYVSNRPGGPSLRDRPPAAQTGEAAASHLMVSGLGSNRM